MKNNERFQFSEEVIKTLMEWSSQTQFVRFNNVNVFNGDANMNIIIGYQKSPNKFISSIRRKRALKFMLMVNGYTKYKVNYNDFTYLNKDYCSNRYVLPNLAYIIREIGIGFLNIKDGIRGFNERVLEYNPYEASLYKRILMEFKFGYPEFIEGGTYDCKEFNCSEFDRCYKRNSRLLTYINSITEDEEFDELIESKMVYCWFMYYISLCETVIVGGKPYIDLYTLYRYCSDWIEDKEQQLMFKDIINRLNKKEFLYGLVFMVW